MEVDYTIEQMRTVEKKWQQKWNEAGTYEADPDKKKEKYFGNFPFPYVNGAMHLGHGYSALKLDAVIRYQKMLGKNTLWPFAFHATGEPIVGMAKRVTEKNENQLRALKMSGVPDAAIKKFEDPYYIVKYFAGKAEETFRSLGLAVDWRRKFTTTQLYPVFSKFVEWQYTHLKQDGYVVKGSHPVIWCPSCKSPTGDHDRLEGEGSRITDFVIIKFYSEQFDAYFTPGTLRPETVFGVTNMFVHPDATYVKVKINGDNMIIAQWALQKFEEQEFEVGEPEILDTAEIIGSKIKNPVNDNEIIILPGEFIDAQGVTGVVMSVPAHAPVDWATLKQIQRNAESYTKYGIDPETIRAIQPISLIKVDSYGEFPAGEIVDAMNITDQKDSKLKEATKIIYRKEGTSGKTTAITGKYEGKSVAEVKELVKNDMVVDGTAIILKEPSEPVVCRCGTRNFVKKLKEQWFLKFSDPAWKKQVHELVDTMNIYPEEARNAFHHTVDWLENKACVRKSGLGTPAPWDPNWIIETLSDSVIYMIFYVIAKYVNDGRFKEEWAVNEIFDYILLKKGEPKALKEKYGITQKLLKEIQAEVDYWYGFDLRSSGKDLINNHLTFMLFHHVAIFPKKYWPRGIHVNGYVKIAKKNVKNEIVEEKMSKSKGNFKTINDMIDVFGTDVSRLAFLVAGEGLNDATINIVESESYGKWISALLDLSNETPDDDEIKQVDKWLYSKMQMQIGKTREYLSTVQTRSAFQSAYHEPLQLLKLYVNKRKSRGPAFAYTIETVVKMITPFIPHVAEEIWKNWGQKGFIVESAFPEVNEELIDLDTEYAEKYLSALIDDIQGLVRLIGERNNKDLATIQLFISEKWKYTVYNEAYKDLKNVMKNVMQDQNMRQHGKAVSNYAKQLLKQGGPPDFPWSYEMEFETLTSSQEYLQRVFKAKVEIMHAEDSDHPKAKVAIPRRPGVNLILVE